MSKTFQTVKAQGAALIADAVASIRAAVKAHGVEWVAAKILVHERTVARWNDGKANGGNEPTRFVAQRILAVLGRA